VTTAERRPSLWALPAVRSLFALNVLGFVSYSVLVSALPAQATRLGAGLTAAGAVTTVFLVATVLAQLAVPVLVRRWGLAPVLAGGLLALGLPAPLYVLADDARWLAVVSAVRGLGFAALCVLGGAIAASVVPPERRGESLGIYGLAVAVPTLVTVPAGTALTLAGDFWVVALLATAPVAALVFVPRATRPVPRAGGEAPATGSRAAVRAALPPSLVLLVVTLAGGGLLTFLPIERPDGRLAPVALLLFGLTSAVSRWRAGLLVDRVGARLLLPLALGTGVVGMLLVALGLTGRGSGAAAAVLGGALAFGAAYGAVQNLSMVLALRRAGDGPAATVSAVWNASFDSGTAIGAAGIGAVAAAGLGLPWTYVLVAVLLAIALPAAVAVGAERSRVRSAG
jgi:predicted MFS family arabinose efflux permease